jgi:hypothetical protein
VAGPEPRKGMGKLRGRIRDISHLSEFTQLVTTLPQYQQGRECYRASLNSLASVMTQMGPGVPADVHPTPITVNVVSIKYG